MILIAKILTVQYNTFMSFSGSCECRCVLKILEIPMIEDDVLKLLQNHTKIAIIRRAIIGANNKDSTF